MDGVLKNRRDQKILITLMHSTICVITIYPEDNGLLKHSANYIFVTTMQTYAVTLHDICDTLKCEMPHPHLTPYNRTSHTRIGATLEELIVQERIYQELISRTRERMSRWKMRARSRTAIYF